MLKERKPRKSDRPMHEKIDREETIVYWVGFDSLLALIKVFIKRGTSHSKIAENDPVRSFERGWHEAMNGEVHPIETLWDGIDED